MVAGPNGRSDYLAPHGNPFPKPGMAASIIAEAESFLRLRKPPAPSMDDPRLGVEVRKLSVNVVADSADGRRTNGCEVPRGKIGPRARLNSPQDSLTLGSIQVSRYYRRIAER